MNDIVFQCRKCGHLLYIEKDIVEKILDIECPNCGEESCENWVIIKMGDYKEEYGE